MNVTARSRTWAVGALVLPLVAAMAMIAAGPARQAQAADTSAPFWPTGTPSLIASTGANFIRVGGATGWTEATDTPSPFVGKYEIYRSTTTITATNWGHYIGKVESSATRRFDDYGAIPGENYYYCVIAADSAGNRSVTSAFGVKLLATASYTTMPGKEVPHDAYADNSNLCRDCHVVHGAVGPTIFRKGTEKEVCYTCHDGTGSDFDVRNGSTPQSVSDFGEAVLGSSTKTSYHPVPNATKVLAGDTGMACSDCHIAHKSPTAVKRLLSAGGPSGPSSGNAFCWTCHGTASSANGYKMGGNHYTSYYNLAAHSAEVSLTLSAWQPASGTQINCENCHKSHGASTTRLTAFRLGTDYTEENLCFGGTGGGSSGCHGTGATKNMYQHFDGSGEKSYHAIGGTSYDGLTGAKVECSSCHGPHTVRPSWKLTDPDNTKSLLTTASAGGNNFRTYFCNDCHKSGALPTAVTNQTTIIPYSIAFPNVSSYLFFPGWDKNSYYYTSGHWLQSFDPGYDTVRDCGYCHAPHGTAYSRLTKWSEENTCYQCHQSTKPTGVGNAKDIQSEMTSTVTTVTAIYGTRGGNTNFDRYNVTPNNWTSLTATTTNFGDGTALVWTGGNYIYATVGATSTFRRYDISSNAWESRTSPGVNAGAGASMVYEGDYIYYFQGDNTNKAMRYTISTDAWNDVAMADVNVGGTNYSVSTGGDSAHETGSDYIYLLQGNTQTRFLRYSISGNTYVAMTAITAAPGAGANLEWAGGSAYLYATLGGGNNTFYRYNIATNDWTGRANVTNTVGAGGALAWGGPNGSDYIYCYRAGGQTSFYRYSITGNSWSTMTAASGAINAGGALTRGDTTQTVTSGTFHPTPTAGRHSDTETASGLDTSNRHSECVDCHDPHRATRTGSVDATKALHPSFTATIGPALVGAWGVEPNPWSTTTFTASTAYSLFRLESTTTRMEYQLCFRCHTYYAYGNSPPQSPSLGTTETDLSMDFNIKNDYLHPVTTAGKNDYKNAALTFDYSASLINGWKPTSRMTCTDCHTNETTATASVAGGPHGSINTFILKAPWDANTGRGNATNPGDASDLCFFCHDYNTYYNGTNNNTGFAKGGSSNVHDYSSHQVGCIVCHGRIPHGLNRTHGIVLTTDPQPYRGPDARILEFKDTDARDYSSASVNCTSTASGCTRH